MGGGGGRLLPPGRGSTHLPGPGRGVPGGVLPSQGGGTTSRQGGTTSRWGGVLPHRGVLPPAGGYHLQVGGTTSRWGGVLSPERGGTTSRCVLGTLRAVCLLRSRRRTFLFQFICLFTTVALLLLAQNCQVSGWSFPTRY